MNDFKLNIPNPNNEETIYVSGFVPKSVVSRLEMVKDSTNIEKIIENEFKHVKRAIQNDLECLGDDIVMFKGKMIEYRKAYEQAITVELEANYKLWESYDLKIHEIKQKIANSIETIKPLKQELNNIIECYKSVENLCNKVNTYPIKNLIEVIEKINSQSSVNKEMLNFLFKNYTNDRTNS